MPRPVRVPPRSIPSLLLGACPYTAGHVVLYEALVLPLTAAEPD